jgi:hypothetical protein
MTVPATDPTILRLVPHRPPILRIHSIAEATADGAVVLGQEPTGSGALSWACGAIEGIAQAAAVLLGQTAPALPTGDAGGGPQGMLVAVKRLGIVGEPRADQPIAYRVRLIRRLGPTAMVAGEATQGERLLARGEITLWTNVAAAPTAPSR